MDKQEDKRVDELKFGEWMKRRMGMGRGSEQVETQ